MKNKLQFALVCLLMINVAVAQRAKIVNEPVTPHQLSTLGLTTNSVSPGLDIVGNHTFVYLSALNIGNSDTIQTASFSFISKPTGSAATLTAFNKWVYFQTDVKGDYVIGLHMVTASGSHDTTRTITAADYVGVGNFDGVAGSFPKCMTCHAGTPKFAEIFSRWQVSGHANIFKTEITTGGAYYGPSCFPCHTTGYNHNVTAANNGFDEVAAQLGWTWVGPPNPGKWDTLKTQFPGLVNLATIGCENCHGAGSEHAFNGGNTAKIQIGLNSGVCTQCHDEPWRHNKVAEWENSVHAEAVWENSFAQGTSSQNNSLGNCIRCHDARGYVNFIKGVITNTVGWNLGKHEVIGCSTCHDPHGNTETANLRNSPAASDTLGNGYAYTLGGVGQTCMNCHKARRNVTTYVTGTVTSTWGPHHSVQSDVLFGQNAAVFGTGTYMTNAHIYAVSNLCVDCHMVATPDTGNVNRNKVGGHTFMLHNPETNFDLTTACTNCHGPKENFESFMATVDHDGDGTIESLRGEIAGLERLLRIALPPVGVDSISWQLIAANNNLTEKKAYWNYQLIAYDGSGGMHNSKFAIDVLTKSIIAAGGVIPVQMVTFTAQANGNTVSLNWETATETNNKGFEVERKTGKSFERVAFISGNGTTTESKTYSYTDRLNSFNGKVVYRIKQIDFDGTAHYSKEVSAEVTSPVEFQISQNYPNPFNPSTRINYSLPVDSKVKVSVYSISGELVKELVNANQPAGTYDVEFNTSSVRNLSSGVYFYNIEAVAGDGSKTFKETRKMVLLK